ncbi:hypothetical protein AAF712_004665 [Marasmius tenuissimus]|uniref:Uncharacterized protein n=1 Tax=Marasmius tenuissimus TaxID=585030 RepID=A0ABR3A3R1_9AGAR
MVAILSWSCNTKSTDPKKALLFEEAYPDANLRTGAGLPSSTCTPCPSGKTHYLNITVSTKVGYIEKVGTLSYWCPDCQAHRGNVWYGSYFPYARAEELAALVDSWDVNHRHEKAVERANDQAHQKAIKAAMKASGKEFWEQQREQMKAIKEAENAKKKAEAAQKREDAAAAKKKANNNAPKSKKPAGNRLSKGKRVRCNLVMPIISSTPKSVKPALPRSAPATTSQASKIKALDFGNTGFDSDSDSDLPELADALLPFRKGTSTDSTLVALTSVVSLRKSAGRNKKRGVEDEGSDSKLSTPPKCPKLCLEFDGDEILEYNLPESPAHGPSVILQAGDADRDNKLFNLLHM